MLSDILSHDEKLVLNQLALDKGREETLNNIMIALASANALASETKEILKGLYSIIKDMTIRDWNIVQDQMPFDLAYSNDENDEEFEQGDFEEFEQKDIDEFVNIIIAMENDEEA